MCKYYNNGRKLNNRFAFERTYGLIRREQSKVFVCLQITWPRRESPCRVYTIDRRDKRRLLFSIVQKGCVRLFFLEIYYYNYYFTLFLGKRTGKKRRFANRTGSPREIDLKRKRKYPSLYIWKGSVKEKAIMNVHRSC